jgi:methanethiol S-methyltransferase
VEDGAHFGPFHIASFVFIGGGFVLISAAWKVLYDAQRRKTVATTGAYSYVRHPQYVGFILVMFGFLLQWPTILTLAMFPVLTIMYVKLAKNEEREAEREIADEYRKYAAEVPGFIPKIGALFGASKGSCRQPMKTSQRSGAGQK